MRIVSSADWRDAVPFESPVVAADVAPGASTKCFLCGAASEALPRTELWAVKHRHPNDHGGYVRFYCAEHRPAAKPAPVVAAAPPRTQRKERRAPVTRRPAAVERQRETCPNCFVEVSASGECGMCGWSAA